MRPISTRHLGEDELIDVAEGTSSEASKPHLASCAECRRQVSDLRALLAAAADADVPEPSPLFWDRLSARVRDAVAADGQREAASTTWATRWMIPALALAAVVLAAALVTLRTPAPPSPDTSTAAPSRPSVDLDPTAASDASLGDSAAWLSDDPSLTLLADLAGDLDWDAAVEAGLMPAAGAVERVVFEMSESERLELQKILQQELARQGA